MKYCLSKVTNHILFPIAVNLIITALSLVIVLSLNVQFNPTFIIFLIVLIGCLQALLLTTTVLIKLRFPLLLQKVGASNSPKKFKKYALHCVFFVPFALFSGQELLSGLIALSLAGGLMTIHWSKFYIREGKTQKFMTSYEPDILVYVCGGKNNAYQINQWLPVFEKSKHKICILLRDTNLCAGMHETDVPIFVAITIRDIEKVVDLKPKVALYTGNPMKNVELLRFTTLKHIFINHGESDKTVNQNKLMLAYDHLFLGGKLAEDRLNKAGLHLREGQAVHIGRPQTGMLLSQFQTNNSRVNKVLYAPTWEGIVDELDYSSVRPEGLTMLEQLLKIEGLDIKVKFHPLTGTKKNMNKTARRSMTRFCIKNNIEVVDSNQNITEVMNWSDMMICDISSVLNEYLPTRKPIVLTNFQGIDASLLAEEYISSKGAYILKTSDDIAPLISRVQKNDPEKRNEVEKLLEYSLSVSKGDSFERFENELSKLCHDAP